MIRRWVALALAAMIPLIYGAAFAGMAWVRSQQGHGGNVYPSEISGLAIRKTPADPLADSRRRGRAVYEHYCQICHGEKGKGDGFNSASLQPRPRDLTDATFWQGTTDERVYYAVAQGGPSVGKSPLMPAWGHTLRERQIRDVITYIRALAERGPSQAR